MLFLHSTWYPKKFFSSNCGNLKCLFPLPDAEQIEAAKGRG